MSPTYEDEQKVVKALVKSGLLDWIGILGAFRGVQNERFPGTIGGRIYWWFELFSECTSIFNVITMSSIIVMADKPGTRWMAAFPAFCSFLSLYLSLYPRFKKKEFRSLFASFDSVFTDPETVVYLEQEIEKGALRTRTITYLSVVLQFLPFAISCAILPVVNEALDHAIMPRKIVIPAMFPFDPLASLPNYLLAVFCHMCGSIFVIFKIIGFMETFFIFASRLVAMFKTLKLNLRQILEALDEVNRNYPNFADREALSEHLVRLLKAWVKHHQQCLRILRELESLYSWPFALYFGAWILVICTATLVFTDDSVDRMTVVVCGAFLTGAIIQLLTTSRMGDTITYGVDGLTSAIHGTDFNLLNKKEYRYLRIILTRCQKISVIQAVGLFPLSIETFKSIMASSYSYYTMLKKMNEKSNQ
ncbi:Odorant receptor [Nesidiocoris tenuis]|uniref:Odorant receptor n=1 Tax=Nesidiocoris tenuis TaxID=355587 RepID=A0ABN7AT38_9HEMI|nr:Odorant receptor [Nesidiocoris tenuis]